MEATMMKRATRAAVMATVAGAVLAAAALAVAPPARAAAPQVRTQAPGWYRMMVGHIEITALSDGSHAFPVDDVMVDIARPALDGALARAQLQRPVQGSINAFLVNTGTRLVLVDTGAGALYGPCCGKLLANLRAAGYTPEQVDLVLLTHLHKDHVGGVLAQGAPAFPNAVVRAARSDADYWLAPAARAAAPAFLASFFDSAAAALAPYAQAGRFRPFDPGAGAELAPGIRPVAAPGHTPGHTAYLVEDGGMQLLLWGDVVHVAAIQLAYPVASVKYDKSDVQAQRTRRALLERAARAHLLVGAAHVAFPGLGHVRRDGAGFTWIPVNYDANPAPAD
jgi:glyoxylase-like metal-dependent hydrolase (beta-lactamase superfamily II)